jgi:hypothetical protein
MGSVREGRRLQLNDMIVIDEDDADTYEHSNQSYESLQGGVLQTLNLMEIMQSVWKQALKETKKETWKIL